MLYVTLLAYQRLQHPWVFGIGGGRRALETNSSWTLKDNGLKTQYIFPNSIIKKLALS